MGIKKLQVRWNHYIGGGGGGGIDTMVIHKEIKGNCNYRNHFFLSDKYLFIKFSTLESMKKCVFQCYNI